MSSVSNMAITWAKRALLLKASKFVLTKKGGLLTLKLGAIAGAGYLAYTLLKKGSNDNSLTRIDDIENNDPHIQNGDQTIVV